MANYGDPGSDQRSQWWDVVRDVSYSYKILRLGPKPYFTRHTLWMAEPRAGAAGSRLAASRWPKELRDRAKAVAAQTGIAWKAGNFANLAKGKGYARQLRAQAEAIRPPAEPSGDDLYDSDFPETYDFETEDELQAELNDAGWYVPDEPAPSPVWRALAWSAGIAGAALAGGWAVFRAGRRGRRVLSPPDRRFLRMPGRSH